MSETNIHGDMPATEIITAATDLQTRLESDIRIANENVKDWQRAEQNYGEYNLELHAESAKTSLNLLRRMASAEALLAIAALRRAEVREKSGARVPHRL